MIVKRKDKNQILCEVGDLHLGAVFEIGETVYLKIYNPRLVQEVNAVNVEDGELYEFNSDVKVTPLDAELIVRGVLNEDTSR